MKTEYIVQFQMGCPDWHNSRGFESEQEAIENARDAKRQFPQFGWRVIKQTTEIINL